MEYPFMVIFKGTIKSIFYEDDTCIKFKLSNGVKKNSYKTVTHEINITCFNSELFNTIVNSIDKFCVIYGYLKYTNYSKDNTWYSGNQIYLQDIKVLDNID